MELAVTAGTGDTPPTTLTARVAHVIPEFLPRSTTFVHTLIGHQRRFDPYVFTQRTSNLDEFPVEHVEAHRARLGRETPRAVERLRSARRGFDNSYARWLAERVGIAGCALIHAHFGWSGRDAATAASRLRLPLVTTFYGRDVSETARARRRDPYRRLFEIGDCFIVEGPAMASDLARIGCDRDRIRIVPIGIPVEALAFAPRARRDRLVVVQTGRFVEKKGFDLGIAAFARARPSLGDCELVLVGDGPLRARLEAVASELGLGASVRFTGMVAQEEYRHIVSRADVCLQPSRTAADGDSEGGAPTVILEAQALGIPVVATQHADIPFVVPRPHELVPEHDVESLTQALVAVACESDAERRARVDEAREFVVGRHSAAVTAAGVEAVYDEALA